MTGNTRRELSRRNPDQGTVFTSMDDVKPPIALPGQSVLALSNGEWKRFTVTRVEIRRPGSRREWAWQYFGKINGVSVARMGHEGMIKIPGAVEPV